MRVSTTALMVITIALAGCGRFGSDSGANPLGWFRGAQSGPSTLEPEDGWDEQEDRRDAIPQVLGARLEPTPEGRLLVVQGIGATKGWWDAELVTATPLPTGRIRPDADGVLRLVFRASPPHPESVEARTPARPEVDTITVALPLSTIVMRRIEGIEIAGAGNVVALRP